jgi:hypothetical protein
MFRLIHKLQINTLNKNHHIFFVQTNSFRSISKNTIILRNLTHFVFCPTVNIFHLTWTILLIKLMVLL